MKSLFVLLFLLPVYGSSYPLSPHEVYGPSTQFYIQDYYARMLQFLVRHHPKIQKCLDHKEIHKQILSYKNWGQIIDAKKNTLAPNIEIVYQRWTSTDYQITLKVHQPHVKHWGVSYSINQSGVCKKQKLDEYYKAPSLFNLSNNLFSSLVFKTYQDILFLKTFSLTFITSPLREWAMLHQRELNQMTYRLTWKSENEYTLYYP